MNRGVFEIAKVFEHIDNPIIRIDYSEHYQCYLDKEK